MATDDINLPNLVSHLGVDLDGVSGAIADATRQGSAMGSALGSGINRQLDDLLRNLPQVEIDGNSGPLDEDLQRIHRELAQLDAQRIGVDISVPDALRQLEQLETNLQRIGDEHPEVNVRAATRQAAAQLEQLRQAARQLDDTDVEVDVHMDIDEERPTRLLGILRNLPSVAGAAGGALSGVGVAAGSIGAAVPLVGALVTTLANVAPAAGVAVTGMAAVQLAQGAVQLAAVGMEDALTAALDPSKAEEYTEALEKLAPAAREFAEQVRSMAPDLRDLQQDVQQEVFRGLADNLERTGKVVLPILRRELLTSATALGDMAAGVMGAARELAENGTLGQALGSASEGLRNLSGVPGIVVTALGQIAAAAGPSFEMLTSEAAHAASRIGERLGAAFESGAMQDAIEQAIDLLGQMITVGANVGQIIGGIFNAVPAGGGGLISVLTDVTAALADIVNSDGVQAGLSALFETISVLGETAAPLLAQALGAIGPVLAALGPPAQTLIQALGEGLSPIIDALGPVLEAAAVAVGALVSALSPLLPVVGQLIADLLPVLIPLFDSLTQIIQAFAPAIAVVAEILGQTLGPIFQALPGFIQPFLDIITELAQTQGPLLQDLLLQLQPSFVQLGEAFGQLLVALGPVVAQLVTLGAQLFQQIAPYLPTLISLFASFATGLTSGLVAVLEGAVVPALQIVNTLLTGDTTEAAAAAGKAMLGLQTIVSNVWSQIVSYVQQKVAEVVTWIAGLPGRASSALSSLKSALSSQASAAGTALVSAVRGKLDEAISWVRGLPSRAASALGGLGGVLYSAGASLISGFISGIRSMIPSVQDVLGGLTNSLPDWKGPASKDAKILTPAGKLLIQGFIKGINSETTSKLRSRLESITKALPDNVRKGIGKSLAQSTAQLERLVAKRDSVLKKLEAAEKKLAALEKARSKAASDITEGILSDANITTGHADVNSVSAITVGLQQALKKTQEFQKNIAALKKAGLRSDLLQQIADAGVDAGGATAAALAKATPAELKKINDLQAQLAKSATSTGNTVGDALYSAGIRAAEGLVAGLTSQEKAIEGAMRRIAENMLKTVAKAHDTHSPSRAFRKLGEMDMRGLADGVLAHASRAVGAVRTVAADMLGATAGVGGALAVAVPTGAQMAAVYAGGASGDTTNNFYLSGGDASPDGILRALSWRGLVGRR